MISQGNGGVNPFNPTPATQTGFQQCATVNALYCNSYSIPQTLNNNVPGACCVVGDAPNAGVGYLCAFGANYQAAGCVSTLESRPPALSERRVDRALYQLRPPRRL